ncbi:sensor histidine kinase [Tsuneonella dongtanensis]|uniref:sensor histidine kinase n=1 Tax=Tsuneonella dongtanensis TaxID=692370 RepID=UPI0018DBE022|nr:ATP-binding protein [Tsuneonella dongtanensis]
MALSAIALIVIDRFERASALSQTRAVAAGDAEILAGGLRSELDKFSLVPRVLAEDPQVGALLDGTRAEVPRLNRRLEQVARQTGAAAIYLMDADGHTLAASNWNLPTSFVGSNYGFRDYFRDALRAGSATQFALGTVSRRPGLYIAQRVEAAGKTIGVVAVKVEFTELEADWRSATLGAFVTDGDGIVLITSDPAWRFRATRAIDYEARNRQSDLQLYGVARFDRLAEPAGDGQLVSTPLEIGANTILPRGWTINLLVDPAPQVAAAVATGRLALLSVLVAFGLLVGIAILLRRRREARTNALVAERTATLREQLTQANRLATLGQVSAGIGHEIRQPVGAVRVFAETGEKLLAKGMVEEARTNFARIVELADRIGVVTGELLSFSRRGTRAPRVMPIGQAIDGALLLLRDRIERLDIALERPLPGVAAIEVRGEHVRLEQVLVNLLQNALDAAGHAGRVAISVEADGANCRVTVADDGPGVPAGVRETLFHPFATTKDQGIGLGLVISRDIMRELGGDLEYSEGASGACFIMTIPRA